MYICRHIDSRIYYRNEDLVDIQFQYVNEIEREPNGKVKFVVQNINIETQR